MEQQREPRDGAKRRPPTSGTRTIAARAQASAHDAALAADRLARLHAAAMALNDATSLDQAYTLIVRHARVALGARHALLAIADEGGATLTMVRATGIPPGALDDLRTVAVGARLAMSEAVRARAPVFVPSVDASLVRFPDMAAVVAATKARSCAAFPLEADGAMLGVIKVCFATPRAFPEGERAFAILLAREFASAIRRVRALSAERRARERAEASARASEFLARASSALTQSLDSASTLSRIARIAVPYLADACAIDVIDDRGTIVRAAAAHVDPERERALRDVVAAHPIDARGMHPIAHVMRTGEAQLVVASDDPTRTPIGHGGDVEFARRFPVASYMIVPLVARARVLGAMMLASEHAARCYRRADLALAEDLAGRAALALDNARLYEEARRAVHVRDDLLAIVSHDLRNPLGVVQATVKLMERTAPSDAPARLHHHCEAIRRASDRMTRLIADLLDFASLQAGRLSFEPAPHDPGAVAQEAAAAMRPVAAQHGITIDVAITPGRAVRCDRARVLQVLGNLLGNAIKFTPDRGRIVVGFGAVASPFDGRELARFEVKDSGPGIAPEHLPHVFDRYWQAKATARLGTGLGLTIAKGIVEAHGGAIGVESKPGEGACFFFTIPFDAA